MEKKNKVILAFPRSGTKLLANCYEQNGYHNFGEFFNTFNTNLVRSSLPFAERKSLQEQQEQRDLKNKCKNDKFYWIHTKRIYERVKSFEKYKDLTPSIITVWIHSYFMFPELGSLLGDREFLCLRRENKQDQILSRCLVDLNFNHDNQFESLPIEIPISDIVANYYGLLRTEKLQDYYVSKEMGRIIDFDNLTSGKEDLGFEYTCNTVDQHQDIKKYILNIDEVESKLKDLFG